MAGGLDYRVVYPSQGSDLFTELYDNARDSRKTVFYAKRIDQIGGVPEQFTVSVNKLDFESPTTFEVQDDSGRRFIIVVPEDDPATFTIYV